MQFYGEIQCTIDNEHPDRKYVKDWTEDKLLHSQIRIALMMIMVIQKKMRLLILRET